MPGTRSTDPACVAGLPLAAKPPLSDVMASDNDLCVGVTGATGFLGGALTESLLGSGRRVRLLARDARRAARFEGRVEGIVTGDITDRDAVRELVQGCSTVFHLVSNFRSASGPPESYRRVNVGGTECVVDESIAAEVRRLVHCSTIGVHGDVMEIPCTEESPFNPGDLYQETKLEAEQYCRRKAGDSDTEIVIVRPCSLYGPGDLRMLKMFKLLAKRRFFLLGDGSAFFHAVYIDDVVRGFRLAADTPGIDGETFIIGGEAYLPLRDYVATAARALGVEAPVIRLPYAPLWHLARLVEALCVPFGIEPPLHKRRVRFFRNNRAFSIEKATRVLGYRPEVALEEGMRSTVAWYREHGYL